MPTFFIPGVKEEDKAEAIRVATVKFAEHNGFDDVTDRRIFKLAYRHNGLDYVAQVGLPESIEKDGRPMPPGDEIVTVILETSILYLVCTMNRGVARGTPIIVGKHDAYSVEDFD